jgi:hypothetical protein
MSEDTKEKILKLSTSEVAKALLSFKGKKFSLTGYKPLEMIYNVDPSSLVVKCCRQVGKSVSIGAILLSKSVARPFFNSVYISPLSIQTSRFSKLYLQPFAESPLIKKYYRDHTDTANIFMKQLNNGSIIFLSYAQTEDDSDRVRGIAADLVCIDEAQDISLEALPVIYETLSASDYAYKRLFGTAKNTNNTLEILFNKGSGCEWVIKCSHCSKWNIPNTIENCLAMCSSPVGPICHYCYKPIDVGAGNWVAARPMEKDHLSFHIPRHIIEARIDPKKWKDMQLSLKNYTPAKVANEIFGLSAGVGGRILSEAEAMNCCDYTRTNFDTCWAMDSRSIVNVVMGVDWSTTSSTKSFTVITILGYDYMGKCYLMFTERLNGVDILEQVARVEYLFLHFKCQRLHGDRGVGVLQGQLLEKSLGLDRVCMVQYTAQKVPLRYDNIGKYIAADRTMLMDLAILRMKLGPYKFSTPCWDIMSDYFKDALAVFEEETLSGRRVYRKDDQSPDDWLHSVVFAHSSWMFLVGQFEYVTTVEG